MGDTERDVFDRLHRRYAQRNGDSERWVKAEHVRNGLGYYGHDPAYGPYAPLRIADFLALDMWESHGLRIIGHEVKVSRSDWLRELKDPTKGEAWAQWCHEWYVVAPRRIVNRHELPEGWGLIEFGERTAARMVMRSSRPAPPPMPTPIMFGVMRAVQSTAQRTAAARTGSESTT